MARKPQEPLVFEDKYDPPPEEEQYQTLHEIYQILAEELVTQHAGTTATDGHRARRCWAGWSPADRVTADG